MGKGKKKDKTLAAKYREKRKELLKFLEGCSRPELIETALQMHRFYFESQVRLHAMTADRDARLEEIGRVDGQVATLVVTANGLRNELEKAKREIRVLTRPGRGK